MNKLMLFPIAFMLIFTVISFVWTGQTYIGNVDTTGAGNTTINGDTGTWNTGYGGSISVNAWAVSGVMLGVMILIITAVGIGILSGFNVLGSGLQGEAVLLITKSIVWLGLWGILSIASSGLMLSNGFTFLIWAGLSFVCAIGLGFEFGGSSVA